MDAASVRNILTANLISDESMLARFPRTRNPYVTAVVFESVLYGIYFNLSIMCFYLLIKRRTPTNLTLLLSAFILFAFATADIIYTYHILFKYIMEANLSFQRLYPKYMMYVTCSMIADSILLYRCWVIWDRKNYVVVIPSLLLVATTACGYIFEGTRVELFSFSYIYLCMNVSLNIMLTSMTAGRIWWLRGKLQQAGYGDVEIKKRSNRMIAFLIETGLITSLYTSFNLIAHNCPAISASLDAGLIQVVVIMPTLIMVQVGLQNPNGGARHTICSSCTKNKPMDDFPSANMTWGGTISVRERPPPYVLPYGERRGSNFKQSDALTMYSDRHEAGNNTLSTHHHNRPVPSYLSYSRTFSTVRGEDSYA